MGMGTKLKMITRELDVARAQAAFHHGANKNRGITICLEVHHIVGRTSNGTCMEILELM